MGMNQGAIIPGRTSAVERRTFVDGCKVVLLQTIFVVVRELLLEIGASPKMPEQIKAPIYSRFAS
jgi:hypothetical protein